MEVKIQSFIIKSGNKDKSINSYISKICSFFEEYDKIELKAYGYSH